MKRNKTAKFVALFALFGIVIGIIGTGLLVIFSDTGSSQEQSISPEEIQRLIESYSGSIETNSGAIESLTGSEITIDSGSVTSTGEVK